MPSKKKFDEWYLFCGLSPSFYIAAIYFSFDEINFITQEPLSQ